MPYVVTDNCVQCGACAAGCGTGAIQEGNGRTRTAIDVAICIECGLCAADCPFQAIIFVEQVESGIPVLIAN